MMKKHGIELEIGSRIIGKWHKNSYTIQRKLGTGTVGSVYLCRANDRLLALKISQQNASMITEGNVLKELNKVQGRSLGPYLFERDDWEAHGKTYSFYTMEYIEGVPLDEFIRGSGNEWIGVLMIQLLTSLEALHRLGWVFGDLKTENLIVTENPVQVRLIDVGGTTRMGRSIKEHTEFFDRGYWGLGSRKAEPSYDLFALAMVFLALYQTDYFPKNNNPQQMIERKLAQTKPLQPYGPILKQAIRGKYHSSYQMKRELLHLLQQQKVQNGDLKMERLPIYIESVCMMVVSLLFYLSAKLFF